MAALRLRWRQARTACTLRRRRCHRRADRIGSGALVGLSIHSIAEARALDPGFVDYAVAGPVFETPSKPGYGPALGPEGIRAIAAAARVPIIAIGGSCRSASLT